MMTPVCLLITLAAIEQMLLWSPNAFDPSSIAGLKMWLKADSLALSDGAAVSSWTDSSGNGNTASQATGANQPIYKTAIVNGKPVVRFDGVNDLLLTAGDISVSQPSTLFVICKRGAVTAGAYQMFVSGSGTTAIFTLNTSGTYDTQYFAGTVLQYTTVALDANFHLFIGVFNGASSAGYRDSSTAAISGNAGAAAMGQISIGAQTDATSPLAGDVAEMGIYNVAITAGNISSLIAYSQSKYATP